MDRRRAVGPRDGPAALSWRGRADHAGRRQGAGLGRRRVARLAPGAYTCSPTEVGDAWRADRTARRFVGQAGRVAHASMISRPTPRRPAASSPRSRAGGRRDARPHLPPAAAALSARVARTPRAGAARHPGRRGRGRPVSVLARRCARPGALRAGAAVPGAVTAGPIVRPRPDAPRRPGRARGAGRVAVGVGGRKLDRRRVRGVPADVARRGARPGHRRGLHGLERHGRGMAPRCAGGGRLHPRHRSPRGGGDARPVGCHAGGRGRLRGGPVARRRLPDGHGHLDDPRRRRPAARW